ncbi:MAG: c-type cytochrome domain-containing protein [Kofleriaceae bacterium]|nr:c-type cytochrome domain-containing protein [Kofleriaceae bacterium]
MMRAAWLALACGASAGCIESLAPDVGPLAQPVCVDVDSDPEVDVSLSRDLVGGVFARRCAVCHTPGGATPIGIAVGGLELTSYATLLRGGAQAGPEIVVPGEPCASVLVLKVSDAPPFGARMPLEGPALSLVDRLLVADWIVEGARDN